MPNTAKNMHTTQNISMLVKYGHSRTALLQWGSQIANMTHSKCKRLVYNSADYNPFCIVYDAVEATVTARDSLVLSYKCMRGAHASSSHDIVNYAQN